MRLVAEVSPIQKYFEDVVLNDNYVKHEDKP